ncbi:MAG: 16S rRNA (guanine(966)-N(2))-methyltransferase RsmD [Pseudomonadota bacterium]|jgi:16S rRNA (guanine966-N2)-methyltransferase
MKKNRVRIVGGAWRSRLIDFPDVAGLRPTPDRVRETLFNWLGQTLDGKECLDLFAGSGAMGFEALSRGARRVVMVERDAAALQALRGNAAKLGAENLELVPADALKFLEQEGRRFDVIFLDPPYREQMVAELLAKLPPHLAAGGLVYTEGEEALLPGAGWDIRRSGRAGKVHYYLLERSAERST